MVITSRTDGNSFFAAGMSYRKSDTTIRSQYALDAQMISKLLLSAKKQGLSEVLVLSTCNRTEIYGLAASHTILVDLLCTETTGDASGFYNVAYVKKNNAAVDHLFRVAAGLDSQILGDYEIVGQLKAAMKISKENGTCGTFIDRLFSSVLQSSKEIKNSTSLSSGSVSVSFAAVQMIVTNYPDLLNKKILLLGTGKIGTNTCKNLVDYARGSRITLMNRSHDKAVVLARKYGLRAVKMNRLDEEVRHADVIVVATSANEPVLTKKHLEGHGKKLIIDLSLPINVDRDAEHIPSLTICRIDELSRLKDDTLVRRQAEIPVAQEIINKHMLEFKTWSERRKHAPLLHHLKKTLRHIQTQPYYVNSNSCSVSSGIRINKVLGETAQKVNEHNRKGCQFISAINQFIAP